MLNPRNEPKISMPKFSYYRKQAVEKLYRLLKRKVLIDMRIVKRFRIWQILILKRKISIFMRKVKETNKRFLQRSLSLIIEVLKKPLHQAFNKIFNAEHKAAVPKSFTPKVAVCKFAAVNIKILSKVLANCLFPFSVHDFDIKTKAFGLWKSRAYSTTPFLHRHLVLTLSVLSIIFRHRWQRLSFAWRNVLRMSQRAETIMLCKSLRKLFIKKIAWAYRKVSQPRFPKKKVENNKGDGRVFREKVKTAGHLLEFLIRKKKAFESRQLKNKALRAFNRWNEMAGESSVPSFIMKRYCRSWSSKLMLSFLSGQVYKKKNSAFYMIKKAKRLENLKMFQIDKEIIGNQAKILVRLESQHYMKLKEIKSLKQCQKLNGCKKIFWKCLDQWFNKWKNILSEPENMEVFTM